MRWEENVSRNISPWCNKTKQLSLSLQAGVNPRGSCPSGFHFEKVCMSCHVNVCPQEPGAPAARAHACKPTCTYTRNQRIKPSRWSAFLQVVAVAVIGVRMWVRMTVAHSSRVGMGCVRRRPFRHEWSQRRREQQALAEVFQCHPRPGHSMQL